MPWFKKLSEHRNFKAHYEQTLTESGKALAVYYYSKVPNWGDVLNQYLLEKITGAPVVLCNSQRHKHICSSIEEKLLASFPRELLEHQH